MIPATEGGGDEGRRRRIVEKWRRPVHRWWWRSEGRANGGEVKERRTRI